MAKRALALWREHDARWSRALFRRTGAIWLLPAGDPFGATSVQALQDEGIPVQRLSIPEARTRWPQISFDGVASVLFEPDGGYLLARRACEHVVERVVAEGGEYRQAYAQAPGRVEAPMRRLALGGGASLEADAFVFACGPWLGRLFPDVIGSLVKPTRQEVHYFGAAAGDGRFNDDRLPVWVDMGTPLTYGIPGAVNRGFKVADDTSGPDFDPTDGSRDLTPDGVLAARTFLRRRFPDLATAPFLGGEVCQYEASPDSHFIADAHPAAPNVWLVGGGSGHGFKMGPAMGEHVADLVLKRSAPAPQFGLARFKGGKPAAP
jgi:glycine/D-amino acid oxidase-like deaminating enzyme